MASGTVNINTVKKETGSGDYISSYTLNYEKVGRLCVFSVRFAPNTTISSSTGTFATNKLPKSIANDCMPFPVTRQDQTYAIGSETQNRFLIVHSNGSLRAVGAYSSGVVYSASGAYITDS